ncbi:hypothetical protein JW859_00645 [bacterium]|nr:hypothetical protein [bacterium]
MDEKRLNKVEELLRAEQGVELSADFKQNVMAEINRLPEPELLTPRRTWRDAIYALKLLTSGEKVALGLILAAVVTVLWPGASELLAAAEWELADLTLSLSFGETAVSASLASVMTIGAGALFMTGVGAYAARNNLIGA